MGLVQLQLGWKVSGTDAEVLRLVEKTTGVPQVVKGSRTYALGATENGIEFKGWIVTGSKKIG